MYGGIQLQSQYQIQSSLQFRAGGTYNGNQPVTSDVNPGPAKAASPASIVFVSQSHYSSSVTYSRPVAETESVSGPEQRAQGASSTILTFIEAQLLRDLADGATPEELESRIQAGLDGFEKGFSEASELLQGLQGMSEEIWGELEHTRDLVRQGVNELRQRFLGEEAEADSVEQEPAEAATASSNETAPVAIEAAQKPSVSSLYTQQSGAASNSFSFMLTTTDGDKVRISASSLRASLMESYVDSLGNVQVSSEQAQRDRFQLKVEGELDADELRAINDLLSQVAVLSEQFFAGDVEQAYSLATELGFDSSEISQFALRLKHTSVQQMSQAYNRNTAEGSKDAGRALHPLADYVESLLQAYDTATRFQQPLQLMQDLASNIGYQQQSLFVESMRLAVRN